MPESEYIENVRTDSPELTIEHIIGNPPGFLLKSGITMVAIIIVLVLFLTGLISYPDSYIAQGQMTSEKPPIDHVAHRTGVIDSIFVEDGSTIGKTGIMLSYRSEVKIADFITLKTLVDSVRKLNNPQDFTLVEIPQNLHLGELLPDYVQLFTAIQRLQNHLLQNLTELKINEQQEKIYAAKYAINYLDKEKSYIKKTHLLEKAQHQRDSILLDRGVISISDYEKSLDNFLISEKEYTIFDIRKETHEQTISQSSLLISMLKEEYLMDVQELYLNVHQAIGSLGARIHEFTERNFIIAEVEGEVSIPPEVKQGNALQAGQLIGTIIQEKDDKKYAEIVLPIGSISKIEIGSRAIVRLLDYPSKEFGTIISEVEKISPLPTRDNEGKLYYNLRVMLGDTLLTTYGLKIPYKPNAPVEVEVISEERSILTRIFNEITEILYNK